MKKAFIRSLFRRAPIRRQLMIMLSVLSLSSVFLGFVLLIYDNINAYERYEARLGSYIASLAADFSLAPVLFEDREGALERLAYLETIPGVMSAIVTASDGAPFVVWESAAAVAARNEASRAGKGPLLWLDGRATFDAAIIHEGERIGEVEVSVHYSALRDTLWQHLSTMALILVALLAVSLGVAYLLQRPISSSITGLAEAADSIAGGVATRLKPSAYSSREIEQLYDKFQLMLTRIDERERERDAVQQQLRQAHDELEARVVQRTRELEQANEVLRVEIRERNAVEKQLTRTLREKEVLLREIHHRVKNNLNVVYGLLALQARKLDDPGALDALAESQRRVKVMATVHETLYESTSVSHVQADVFASRIVSELKEVYAVDPSRLRIETAFDCFILDLQQAIPVGLILNELITNALKHAFPDSRRGVLRVAVSLGDVDGVELVVCDDGVGMEAAGNGPDTGKLGLKLVEALARQLDGQVEFAGSAGTRTRVVFPHRIG